MGRVLEGRHRRVDGPIYSLASDGQGPGSDAEARRGDLKARASSQLRTRSYGLPQQWQGVLVGIKYDGLDATDDDRRCDLHGLLHHGEEVGSATEDTGRRARERARPRQVQVLLRRRGDRRGRRCSCNGHRPRLRGPGRADEEGEAGRGCALHRRLRSHGRRHDDRDRPERGGERPEAGEGRGALSGTALGGPALLGEARCRKWCPPSSMPRQHSMLPRALQCPSRARQQFKAPSTGATKQQRTSEYRERCRYAPHHRRWQGNGRATLKQEPKT
mmetsp:Transcript_88937/g.287614  ORF Transcript_88937/g.287614 Transcript_88937/m.287614 type:complete len:274 (-) Transcript_88937:27-848(-)